MGIGLPSLTDDANNIDIFTTLLYQMGGSMYDSSLQKTQLSTDTAIAAFKKWSDFYTKYQVSQKMDQLTRFRTGEAPIVFMPYTFYNSIQAAAPEINGLWGFALLPGTMGADGKVNRTDYATSTGSVIFSNSRNQQGAWEFLKWWTSTQVQAQYGLEMENIQGPSGRWPTANVEALEKLPWSVKDMSVILAENKLTRGMPEVPGGYMTARYVSTAVKLVINNGLIPREAIVNYGKLIDDEITSMRKELGIGK